MAKHTLKKFGHFTTLCIKRLSYNNVFISVVLKWETRGFQYLLQVSLLRQEYFPGNFRNYFGTVSLVKPNERFLGIFLEYWYLCLDLGLYMSSLCKTFFISIFIFILINQIISWKQTHLFLLFVFQSTFYYFWTVTSMKYESNFHTEKVQLQGVA